MYVSNKKGKTKLRKVAMKEQIKILEMILKTGYTDALLKNDLLFSLEKVVKHQSIYVVKEIANHVNCCQ